MLIARNELSAPRSGVNFGKCGIRRRLPLVHGRSVPGIVKFNSAIISLATLSEVHLRTHSASRARSLRSKYRSAIYIVEGAQRREAELAVAKFAEESGMTVHTKVLLLVCFKASETRYQNYYRTDPNRPFCQRYIDPKLDYIRQHFAAITIPESDKAR
jgi:peptide-methionine (S)-S-oxide reductase